MQYRNRHGKLLWIQIGLATVLACCSGLIGGNKTWIIGAESPLATYGAAFASVVAFGLYGLVFGFVFPILSHRMHSYSGQANRLVLHVSRFFKLHFLTSVTLFFVLAVHARVVCAQKWGRNWVPWTAEYNLIAGLALFVAVAMFAHQIQSFVKRVTHQLTTVELISRACGLLRDIISWNTIKTYEPVRLDSEDPDYRNQQLALPS